MLMMLRNNMVNSDLQQQLGELTHQDVVLLMADAVYLALADTLITSARVTVYGPDADARGITVPQLETVSSHTLVDLTEQYSTWIKWE